jgi:hypothetical protein
VSPNRENTASYQTPLSRSRTLARFNCLGRQGCGTLTTSTRERE